MADDIISFDDILGGSTISMDDILGIYPLDIAERKAQKPKKSLAQSIMDTVEQFGRGGISMLTLGLTKDYFGEKPPETGAEKVAAGIGNFVGFLATPMKIGKALGAGAKFVAPALMKAGVKPIVAKTAKHMVQHALTLGGAEAASEILHDPAGTSRRFLHGAKIGAIFGATGLAHIDKYKKLSWVMRQFGGRALLKVTGEYPDEYLSSENLPSAVFAEALNTMFFSRGYTAEQILTGKAPNKLLREFMEIDKEVIRMSKESFVKDTLAPLPEHFTRAQLPLIKDVLQMFGVKKADTKLMQRIEVTEDYLYDVRTKSLKPQTREVKPGEHEIQYKIIDGDVTPTAWGRRVAELDLMAGELDIFKVRSLPDAKLPMKYTADLNARIIGAIPDLKSPTPFYKAFRISEEPKFRDLFKIETKMREVAKAEYGREIETLLDEFITREELPRYDTKEFKTKEIAEYADKELAYLFDKRKKNLAQTRSDVKSGKLRGAPIEHLLHLSFWEKWADVRIAAEGLQQRTGIPLKDIIMRIDAAKGIVDYDIHQVMKPFSNFGKLNPADAKSVETYYYKRYKAFERYGDSEKTIQKLHREYDIAKSELNPRQAEYTDLVDGLMSKLRPMVRLSRWLMFEEAYEKAGENFKKTAQIYKHQANLKELLLEGMDIRILEPERFMDWLNSRGEKLGVIEAGNYLPFILQRKFIPKEHQEFKRFVDTVAKSHLRSRNKQWNIDPLTGDPMDVLRADFFDKPINMRLENYTRQILNLYHLREPLGQLNRLMDMFGTELESARGKGMFRAKAHSTADMLRLYAHRIRGLPIKVGGLGQLAKTTQSVFFRALVVKPFLWMRNVFQRFTMMPHREIMLDPRYLGKKGSFRNIPEEYKMRFNQRTSQFESFDRDWLFLEETAGLRQHWLTGTVTRLAEKVGRMYPLSDLSNRQAVMGKTFNRSRDYIEAYKAGELPFKKLVQRLGLEKVSEPTVRFKILEMIDKGEVLDAAFELGHYMSHNSQWVYKRSGKSFYEMTAEGESFTNLLTWSKGAIQRVANVAKNMQQGYDSKNYSMMYNSGKEFVGMMFASVVASEILAHVSVSHGKKYRDYAADMFVWELGGVSFGLIRDFSEQIGEVVSSFDGSPQEKKQAIEGFMKYIDNIAIRQLIPFAKQALAVAESVTDRAYISPVYNHITKKGYSKVDRTILEAITHAIFAVDPNKSRAVQEAAGVAKQRWYDRMVKTKDPVLKAYYKAQYQRYKYFTDLFMRYEPIEIYKYYEDRAYEEYLEKYSTTGYYKARHRAERKEKISRRKFDLGY